MPPRATTKETPAKPAQAAEDAKARPVRVRKPAPAPKVAAEPAPPVPAGAPAAAPALRPITGTLRLRELVQRVVEATGAPKSQVKATVEATLAELAGALEAGETLNLPGFGKLRVARPGDAAAGRAMVLKLRPDAARKQRGAGKESLAADDEPR